MLLLDPSVVVAQGSQPAAIVQQFDGPSFISAGSAALNPNTAAAVGPSHIVIAVHGRVEIRAKSNGGLVHGQILDGFLGASSTWDPQVIYDPHSSRWFVCAHDLNRLYLAVSSDSTPTTWFRTSVLVRQGVDANRTPDFSQLGFDARGLYLTFLMYPTSGLPTLTILALDKAPLIAPVQALGAATAFRGLPFEGLTQPCRTWDDPGVAYLASVPYTTFDFVRIRAVQPPLTAPTLVLVGDIPVGALPAPPNAQALGSPSGISPFGQNLTSAVHRSGSIWTSLTIGVSGKCAVRWYELDPASLISPKQSGTFSNSLYDHTFSSVAVTGAGDLLLGMNRSNSFEFLGAFFSARYRFDPPGSAGAPAVLTPGTGSWAKPIGVAVWGRHSSSYPDPSDPLRAWTFLQVAVAPGANWTVRCVELKFGDPSPAPYCSGKLNSAGCSPTISTSGTPDSSGPSDFIIRCGQVLAAKPGLMIYGYDPNTAPFQGGVLCIKPPIQRTPSLVASGAVHCSAQAEYVLDFDQRIRSGVDPALVSGARVYAQWWMRDPSSPSFTGLSNAICFGIGP